MTDLPEVVRKAFSSIADDYDGAARKAVSQVLDLGDCAFTRLVETVSELLHQTTEKADWVNAEGFNYLKVDRSIQEGLRLLQDEEHLESSLNEMVLEIAASDRDLNTLSARKMVKAASEAAAEALGKLPAYNQAQWLCREAAIAVGLWQFAKAKQHLKMLFLICGSKSSWEDAATKYEISSSGNLVSYSKAVSEAVDDWGIPLFC